MAGDEPDLLQTSLQIERLREKAARARRARARLELARHALALWRIESLERMSWALEIVRTNAPEQPTKQAEAWHYLGFPEREFPADFQGNGGWSFAVMPSDLHAELLEALAALPFGEVHPILEPAKEGKHGPAYSLGIARLLAVEHVEFLAARGRTRTWVGNKINKELGVPLDTVRGWRHTLLPGVFGRRTVAERVRIAREAGELAETIAADPAAQYGWHNADVLAAYDRHEHLDLTILGREIRELQR
jgi:hypothetical protein